MSECVVRMKKPKSCEECDIATKYQRFGTEICCPFMGWYADYNKCPIFLQLPEEHGRLVDADALIEQHKPSIFTTVTDFTEGQRSVVANIKNAPTIVPATERSK